MLNSEFFESLATLYGEELATAMIKPRALPMVPEIELLLLVDDYPKERLGLEAYTKLMSSPPYWAFCWGGGQAMARYLLDNQAVVKNRGVIDFGAGSAVAGIAASIAGAKSVIAVDIDTVALGAAKANAELNKTSIKVAENVEINASDLVLAADICYEETGIAWVYSHLENGGELLISDSRVEQLSKKLPGVRQVDEIKVKTFPDLEEDNCFEFVKLYSNL